MKRIGIIGAVLVAGIVAWPRPAAAGSACCGEPDAAACHASGTAAPAEGSKCAQHQGASCNQGNACTDCGEAMRESCSPEHMVVKAATAGAVAIQPSTAPAAGQKKASASKQKKKAVAAYSCPMHPEVTSQVPGKCPKCGMKLEKTGK